MTCPQISNKKAFDFGAILNSVSGFWFKIFSFINVLLIFILAAFYIDTDLPVGDPTVPYILTIRNRDVQFRNRNVPSAQKVTDLLFRISFRDLGSRNRTSVIFMTFGQFLDHDFAYVVHGPTGLCPDS